MTQRQWDTDKHDKYQCKEDNRHRFFNQHKTETNLTTPRMNF